ncbi:MAG TPA: ATP-binding protein [Rubrobacter sp.]|nr:ATP-binding protein [Rubrobacter sp.]
MPIRWRLTIFNALVIGVILLALGCALFFLLREELFSSVEDTASKQALAAAKQIDSGEGLDDEKGGLVLDEGLKEGLTHDGVFIVVRNGRGRIITQTGTVLNNGGAQDKLWHQVLETGKPAKDKFKLREEDKAYVYAVPVSPPEQPARIVEVGKFYEPAQEIVDRMALVLASGVGVAFLLSVVGAYLLARKALSPVSAVVTAAHRITEGDRSKRLPVANSKDEIGDLAATINGMLSHLEKTLARLEETLDRQRRFVADASHELRTPLTSIHGYAQVLEEWALRDPQIGPESVAAIKRESERMKELVENLLELARGDEGMKLHLKDDNLTEVVEEAAESARAAWNGKVHIERPTPKQGVQRVRAHFDRDRLRQALSILLDNAVKYTPEGGRVTISIVEEDGSVGVEVSDTGIGIPEDQIPHVFERFYRAEEARSTEGLGLGLSIARQIVEDHGGSIEVRSKPMEGSTFIIRIPRSKV